MGMSPFVIISMLLLLAVVEVPADKIECYFCENAYEGEECFQPLNKRQSTSMRARKPGPGVPASGCFMIINSDNQVRKKGTAAYGDLEKLPKDPKDFVCQMEDGEEWCYCFEDFCNDKLPDCKFRVPGKC